MTMSIDCPLCGQSHNIPNNQANYIANCNCGVSITVSIPKERQISDNSRITTTESEASIRVESSTQTGLTSKKDLLTPAEMGKNIPSALYSMIVAMEVISCLGFLVAFATMILANIGPYEREIGRDLFLPLLSLLILNTCTVFACEGVWNGRKWARIPLLILMAIYTCLQLIVVYTVVISTPMFTPRNIVIFIFSSLLLYVYLRLIWVLSSNTAKKYCSI